MSDNIVEITDNSRYSIEVSTNLETNNNVSIEVSNSSNNIDIINNSIVLVNDIPPGYPITFTTGLLPISRVSGLDILSGSGISVSNSSGIFTVAVTGQFGLTGEQVDDRVNNLLQPGNYVNLNYNDNLDNLTISVTGLQPTGNYSLIGHSHTSSNITDFSSSVDNRILLANLQPSGQYSVVGHGHVVSDVSGLQTLLDSKAPILNPVFSGTVSGISKTMVGLSNVDNTSDINKPVSIAQASADSAVQLSAANDATTKANNAQAYAIQRSNHTGAQLSNTISDFNSSVSGLVSGIYAPIISPVFSGIPTVPTASSGNNSNQIANTSFVRSEISNLVNSAPSTLDTLNELALALGNDPNFSTTITSAIAGKVSKSGDTMTGALIAPTGNFTDKLMVNNVSVSISGHIHSINDISNLQTSLDSKAPILNPVFSGTVSGITKSMIGLGNADNTSDTNKPISTAMQSGLNLKSDIGHAHTSSDITNFNSSVSGLLPVKNIVSSSGISIVNSSGTYTVAVTGNFGLTSEEVDDRVASLLVAGTGIVLNYDDPNNILTVSTSGLAFTSGANFNSLSVTGVPVSLSGHKHIYSDITNFSSGVQDSLTTTLLPGSFINLNYDSFIDTLTISASGLQPSGNYTVVGHTHTSSNISDFNSSVSGLVNGIYAQLNSPSFVGAPLVPTAPSGTNTTQAASTAFVRTEISNLVSSAPSTLDTLNELASALGNDANFSTTITNSLASKANLNGAIFTGPVTIPSGTGNFNNLTVYGIGVSISGHNHMASEITYEPLGVATSATDVQIALEDIENALENRIGATQYASTSDVGVVKIGSGIIIGSSGLISVSTDYAAPTHTHLSSNISNFNSSVSGLLPSVTGIGYINSNFANNIYTISASGLQPSGIYASGIHDHGNITSSGTISTPLGIVQSPASNDSYILVADATDNYLIKGVPSVKSNALWDQTNVSIIMEVGDAEIIWPNVGYADYPTLFRESISAAPLVHSHGNLSSSGTLGSVSGLLAITDVAGILTTTSGISSSYITNFNSSVSELLTPYQLSLTNPVTGVGISGYIPRWISSSGIGSGIIFDNGTSIGIGTNNPTGALDIRGDVRISGVTTTTLNMYDNGINGYKTITVNGNNFDAGSNHIVAGFSVGVRGNRGTNVGIDSNGANGYLAIAAGGSEKIRIDTIGNMGIGTTTPSGQLHVIGTGLFSQNLLVNNIPVSVSGHTHSSSDITNFNSSVSGLISGIYAPLNNPNFSGTLSISGVTLGEIIDDEVAGLLVAGSGISLNYNDSANTLTVDTNVSTSLIAGSGMVLNYNSTTDELSINLTSTIAVSGNNVGIGTLTPVTKLQVNGLVSQSANHAIAGLASDQTITAGADAVLQLIDKDDPNNWWNASTYRFLPTVSGYYSIAAQINWKAGAGTGQINTQLRKNGTTFSLCQNPMVTGVTLTQVLTGIVNLNGSTDYVDLIGYSSSTGGSQLITGTADQAWTKLEAYKIS